MKRRVISVDLAAQPPLALAIFNNLSCVGAKHSAIFGGAVRDADYAARHQTERPIKDYDIRIWLEPTDFDLHQRLMLDRMQNVFGKPAPTPAAGTGHMRYLFQYQGSELDVSFRPVPDEWRWKDIPPAAVACNRALDSDIGLCAVAMDPNGQAWGTPEYLADRSKKTLSVYPIDNPERKATYTARMSAKFPSHRVIKL